MKLLSQLSSPRFCQPIKAAAGARIQTYVGRGAGSFNDGLIATGSVNLIELSFAPAFVLDTQQVGSFTLATIQFSTTGYGSTAIDFGTVVLGDSLGDPLSASLVNTVLVSVPVPAAAWLFGSALGLLGWVRRRANVPAA